MGYRPTRRTNDAEEEIALNQNTPVLDERFALAVKDMDVGEEDLRLWFFVLC